MMPKKDPKIHFWAVAHWRTGALMTRWLWGSEIKTLEGTMNGQAGDWIITGVNGEKYPCKPDIFEKTYEPVEESP
jgi:hypothetical protein